MGVEQKMVQQGFATASSPFVSELFLEDTQPLEPALREAGDFIAAPKKIPFSRYYDPRFAAQEMEKIW